MTVIVEGARVGQCSGDISLSGAKNAALPLLFGALVCDGITRLSNMPSSLRDVLVTYGLLSELGVRITGSNNVELDPAALDCPPVLPEACRKIRYSILLLGALVRRLGRLVLPLPGGCKLGAQRPVDFHIEGLKAFGVGVRMLDGCIEAEFVSDRGGTYQLPFPSVTATQNLLLFAVQGTQAYTIENCAIEPEVTNLACFLRRAGASVEGVGSRTLFVQGGRKLQGVDWDVPSDRIECGTFIALAALLKSDVRIAGYVADEVSTMTTALARLGLPCVPEGDCLHVQGSKLGKRLPGLDVTAKPYPGFPTDLQPVIGAVGLGSEGPTVIVDETFPDRFEYAREFQKLGAEATRYGSALVVRPPARGLRAAQIHCHDIRSGAAALLAALVADGDSRMTGEEQLERGYDRLWWKLAQLGVSVRKDHRDPLPSPLNLHAMSAGEYK